MVSGNLGRSIEPIGNMLKLQKTEMRTKLRTARGAYLLELLVAIFVSGVFALALTKSITEGMRSTQHSQTQVIATWLALEAIERIKFSANRNLSFFDIPTGSEAEFKIYSDDSVAISAYDFAQRPLLLDYDNFRWVGKTTADDFSKQFKGKVTAKLLDRVDEGKNVEVNVLWTESGSSAPKEFSMSAAVFPKP